MKLTAFLLFVVFFQVSAGVFSQNNGQLSLKAERESVNNILQLIEGKSEFRFLYNSNNINVERKMDIECASKSIEEILNILFEGTNVKFRSFNNNYVLFNGDEPISNIAQQQKSVSGRIADSSNLPLPGVTVLEKNTNNGTITNADGNYSIDKVSTGATLVFSFVGLKQQEIPVGSKSIINVTMAEETVGIEEVVAIGYGTVKKKDFTGSVSSVKFENSPVALTTNLNSMESLKGQVTGLDIGYTNTAGGTPAMQIRGQNSISGSNDPLIVVDGTIFFGTITDINPSDIASMDVLKDATSSAAYGSRSANGVVMITTKKGKKGKPVVQFNTKGGLQTWHLKPKLMNGQQWTESVSAANGYSDYSFLVPQEEINLNAGNEINWLDEISHTGSIQDYQAAISGAGEKMNYYLSASYTKNNGVIKGDDFERTSFLGKINTDITNWLQIGFDAAYTHSDYSGLGADVWSATILSPYAMMYRPNGLLEAIPDGSRGRSNPLWGIDDKSKRENIDYRDNIRVNSYVVVKCPWISGLSYRFNYAGNLNYRKASDFTHESYYVPGGSYDDDSRYSITVQNSYLSSTSGNITNERTSSYVMDHILNYNERFGKHNIDLTAVATRDYMKYENQNLFGSDFAANGNTALGITGLHYATTQKISLNNSKHTNGGYLGRGSYSYNDTYYLTGSYRRDGSSVFGSDKRWGNFGAIGASWRISNESFMKKVEYLNDLKLKLSWGKNGNQGLTEYSTLSKVTNGQTGGIYYAFNNDGKTSYGINQSSIGNSDLGWETTEAWNTGFESVWLNNRLFVDADVYFSRTYDQIFVRTIPVMTGFTSMLSSMGEVKNKGVEVNVRSVNISNKEINWTTKLTFWLNRDKLVRLYGEDLNGDGKEDDDIGNGLFIGKSIHSIFGYKQNGIVQANDVQYMEANGVSAGNPKYVDKNNDGVINELDRSIIGNRAPNFKLNLSNTLQFKNWELYVMLAGAFGGTGYFQNENKNAFITCGDRSWFASNGLHIPYWTEANPSNKYPAAAFTGDDYFLGLQSRAYVRLQDVTLSYTFNQPWVKNAGISNFKLFVTGKNLATITGWKGGDPESGSTALSGMYPITRDVSMGVNFSF